MLILVNISVAINFKSFYPKINTTLFYLYLFNKLYIFDVKKPKKNCNDFNFTVDNNYDILITT